MRKLYPILSGIFLILVFTSCKQFTTNIDDYLTYWSSESYVNAHAVRTVHYNDKDNTLSVPSASDVTVMLTVHNPKNFSLVMPTSSADAGKIIRFPALSPQPVHGTDYILTQTANDKLELTYKSSFLQAHEWGARDIGAEITLSSKDGRTFKQNYSFKIRANTPPKLSYVTIGKTKDHDSSGKYYYVIILRAANMTKTAGTASELLHKDIKRC